MSGVPPSFGRRSAQVEPVVPVRPAPRPAEPAVGFDQPAPTTQLRMACLAQLDPASIANMPPEKVKVEVERVL